MRKVNRQTSNSLKIFNLLTTYLSLSDKFINYKKHMCHENYYSFNNKHVVWNMKLENADSGPYPIRQHRLIKGDVSEHKSSEIKN